ncbi:hypothetical protein [Amycolatopsis sp. H20-H5]|uniref:hypothetical protein n=1 Tax=Amycolatopsis sp. H20-H5 TaxID=3046309 RepID=UPI002DB793D5|nr:hypothetical protein [Amycolatopsis sp. H20-H5]MEC3979850.1 hypothetical protein [Amycolatopsis sp. H20-H5]
MPEGNPLVAQAPKDGDGPGPLTAGNGDYGYAGGIGVAESAIDAFNGIKDGDWISGGLGVLGVAGELASAAMDPFGYLLSSAASFLMEHVQPLKDMLDSLAGDPPVIQSYSQTWGNVAKSLEDTQVNYSNAVKNGTASWTGAGADAYRESAKQTAEALSGAATVAGGIGTVVMIMGEVVSFVREFVRQLIADLVGKLISWVLEAVFSLGFGTPVIVAQAVTAIAKWAERITEKLKALVETIRRVSPLLGKLADVFAKIIKILGKLAGKVTGLDAISTKNIKAGGFFQHGGGSSGGGGTHGGGHDGEGGTHGPDGDASPGTTHGDASPGTTHGEDGTPSSTRDGDSSSSNTNESGSPGSHGDSSPGDSASPGHRGDSSPDSSGSPSHQGDSSPGSSGSPSHRGDSSPGGNGSPSHQGDSSPGGSASPSHRGDSSPGGNGSPSHQGDSSPGGNGSPSHRGDSSPGSADGGTPSHAADTGSPSHAGDSSPSRAPDPGPGSGSPSRTPDGGGSPATRGGDGSRAADGDAPSHAGSGDNATSSSGSAAPAPPKTGEPGSTQVPSQRGGADGGPATPAQGQPGAGAMPPAGGGGGTPGTTGGVPGARPGGGGGWTGTPGSPGAHPPRTPDAPSGPGRGHSSGGAGSGPEGRPRQPQGPGEYGPQPVARGSAPAHTAPDESPHSKGSPESDTPGDHHGQPDRLTPDEVNQHLSENTPAGSSYHRDDPDMGDLPHRVQPDPDGRHTVDVHVTPDGHARIGDKLYTPEEFADILRRNPDYHGGPIRLIGCDAGSNDFAHRLSRDLDTEVLAPSKPAWTDSHGRVFSSDYEIGPDGKMRPKIPPNGEWDVHRPDGSTHRASEDGFTPDTHEDHKHDLDGDDAKDRGKRYIDDDPVDIEHPDRTPPASMKEKINDPDYREKYYDGPDKNGEYSRKNADQTDHHDERLPKIKEDANKPPGDQFDPKSDDFKPADYRTDDPEVEHRATQRQKDDAQQLIDERKAANDRARTAEADYQEAKEKGSVSEEVEHERKDAHRERTDRGEDLGEHAATDAVHDKYPAKDFEVKPLPDPDTHGPSHPGDKPGSGRFDQIYEVTDRHTGETRHVVVEAKGPNAGLGTRKGLDGQNYEQGHPKYVESIIDNMRRNGTPAEKKLAEDLEIAQDLGTLDYSVAKARVRDENLLDDAGNTIPDAANDGKPTKRPVYGGYNLKHFDLSI